MIDEHDEDAECRVCGCTQDDCTDCVERTGRRCRWVQRNLCSACVVVDAAHVLKMGPLSMFIIAQDVGVDRAAVESVLREFSAAGPGPAYFTIEPPNGHKLTALGYEKLLEA